jgi:ABC-type amino acid transport substrate-binding protein
MQMNNKGSGCFFSDCPEVAFWSFREAECTESKGKCFFFSLLGKFHRYIGFSGWAPAKSLINILFIVFAWILGGVSCRADEVIFYNQSFTKTIQHIFRTAISRSLALTYPEYGEIRLLEYQQKISLERVRQLTMEGEKIQLYMLSSGLAESTREDFATIDLPFFSNALGLRFFIIRDSDFDRFAKIKSLDDLRQHRIGVGRTWVEKEIFENQNMPFVEAILSDNLLPMLAQQRFDYVAPSALDDLTSMGFDKAKNLIRFPELMLYYPVPVQILVNKDNIDLVNRLTLGLQRFVSSGEANALIDATFRAQNIFQNQDSVSLIMIENVIYNEAQNKQAFASFLEQFPLHFREIIH